MIRTPEGLLVSGRLPLPEVVDLLDLSIPSEQDEGEETVGGHVTALLGRLARVGDQVRLGDHRVVVTAVVGHRIDRLRFEPAPPDPPETP